MQTYVITGNDTTDVSTWAKYVALWEDFCVSIEAQQAAEFNARYPNGI